MCLFNDAVNIFDYIGSNANIDIIYWIARYEKETFWSKFQVNYPGIWQEQHRQPLKPSWWLVFGNKLKFSEREAISPILSFDDRFYLCNVGRKTEGWLLFASIRNAVTAGGLEAARSNSRTATTAETADGWRQLGNNSRTATTADILATEYQLWRNVDRHKTALELLSV